MVECIASLVDVCAGYGAREVLHTLTWSIKAGEFWGLIGPNGSGKSTLLGLFNAMTPASSGHVFFQGEEVTRTNLHRVRTKIAHVFQMVEVDRKIPVTVYEAVLAGTFSKLGLFHRPGAREKALALKAIERVGLADVKDRPLGGVSGGQKQRAAIARALAQEPELMLLDEPTAALDWQAQRDILELIASLQKTLGLTVVMATHDLNAVSHITTHTAMLKSGSFVHVSTTREAMNGDVLSRLYDTPVDVFEHNGRQIALF